MTTEMGYIISDIDPCLLKKIGSKNENKVMAGVYVDDILLVGDSEYLKNEKKILENEF